MKYFVTFGQKYRTEPHPYYSKIHPDGYVTIIAENYGHARDRAFKAFHGKFAFMYEEKDGWDDSLYPLGELFTIYPTERLTHKRGEIDD